MVAVEVACLELRQVVDQCVVPLRGRFTLPVPVGITIHCVPTPLGMVPGTLSISGPFISPVAEGVYSVSSEISARFRFAIQCSPSTVIVEERLSFPLAVLLNLDRLTGVDIRIEVALRRITCFLCLIGPGRRPGELQPLSRLDGERDGDQLGYAVGFGPFGPPGPGEFLAGAPSAGPGGVTDAGSLFVALASDGSVLQRVDGAAAEEELAFSLALIGDVNGDGVPDYIVGAPSAAPADRFLAGSAFIISGLDGSIVRRFDGANAGDQLGWSVAAAGDVDGDGTPDVIVGAPSTAPGGRSFAGSVFVFSGLDGSLLYRFDGPSPGDALGFSVLGGVDLNGDTVPDIVAGAPSASPGGRTDAGSVLVFSGATGGQLYRVDGPEQADELGFSLAAIHDIDGDGTSDLVVGAPSASPGGSSDAGSAFAFSGRTGALLLRADAVAPGGEMGVSILGTVDLDADGFSDFAVGAPSASPGGRTWAGSVFVMSGRTGLVLQRLDGGTAGDEFGWSLANASNVDGAGAPGVVVGAPSTSPFGRRSAGTAYVFALVSPTVALCCYVLLAVRVIATRDVTLLVPAISP
ncbi:MAG: VCBS repeat-containing protein [Bacillota bacterium]